MTIKVNEEQPSLAMDRVSKDITESADPTDKTPVRLLGRALAELEKINTAKVAAAGLSAEATAVSGARVFLDRLSECRLLIDDLTLPTELSEARGTGSCNEPIPRLKPPPYKAWCEEHQQAPPCTVCDYETEFEPDPISQDTASASAPTTSVPDHGQASHSESPSPPDAGVVVNEIEANLAEIRESVNTEYADLKTYRTRLGAALMDSGRLLSIIDTLIAAWPTGEYPLPNDLSGR